MENKPFVKAIARLLTAGFFLFTAFFCADARAEIEEIVGGTEAVPGSWPFMAAILEQSGNPTSQYCGGSLIAPTWVVSAAHCFKENGSVTPASQVRIGLGLHRLSAGGGSIHTVKRIIVHPQYNESTSDYDMALIELNSAASQTPIVVQTGASDLSGVTATAIGWGLTDPNNDNSTSDVLRQVSLPVVTNTQCNNVYGSITARMVCAGFSQGGKDACQGDSGGPLVATISGQTRLIGVTSFGDGCAEPGVYGVYSRTSAFESFIAQYITFTPPSPTDGAYGLWNGFLGMTNIIELVNSSNSAVTAQVNMHSIDGTLISSNFYAVAANSQQDVILNSLQGFSVNSYGLVQVSSNIGGRVFFYRATDPAFSNFEFAFGLPLQSPQTGTSFVGFNTFQPSFNSFDQSNLVANWLSVVNLSTSAQSFSILKYDSDGSLLASQFVTVAAKSRSDFEAGHTVPGPSHVGLIKVVPASNSTPYLAQLMRYGYGANGAFDFAFPLRTGSGSTSTIVVPLGSTFAVQNWLEVLNASDSANNVAVTVFNANGTPVGSQTMSLAARSQVHINVNGVLGDQALGYARVATQSGLPVVAESMFYYRDSGTGSITAMYGSQADTSLQSSKRGSYNLFLGMENYLKLTNTTDATESFDVTVMSPSSSGSSRTVQLGANTTVELPLHSGAVYGTVPDSYGNVVITPSSGSYRYLSEVVRIKGNPVVQFAAPTGLQ